MFLLSSYTLSFPCPATGDPWPSSYDQYSDWESNRFRQNIILDMFISCVAESRVWWVEKL